MSIQRVALSTKFSESQLDSIMEIVTATSNPDYAIEVLLGINKILNQEELLSMKKDSIIVAENTDINYSPWAMNVYYSEEKPIKVDGYSFSRESNQPIENMVAVYSSSLKKSYPEMPTADEFREANPETEIYNVYFLTGKTEVKSVTCSLSNWSK
jgi:hypothetical protein